MESFRSEFLAFFELEPGGLHDRLSQHRSIDGRNIHRRQPMRDHFDHPLGANPQVLLAQQILERFASGAFPRLRGHPRSANASVGRGLGATRVVAVDTTRRNRLENVDVDVGAGFHADSSESGSAAIVVVESFAGEGALSVRGRCRYCRAHRRRTMSRLRGDHSCTRSSANNP